MKRARENPFRSARVRALGLRRSTGQTDTESLTRLVAARRGAIVGPQGSGKSTLMRALADRLGTLEQPVRLVRLTLVGGRIRGDWQQLVRRPARSDETILLDGGGDLHWLPYQCVAQASRRARRLFITCHRPMRLPTLVPMEPTPALLDALLAELQCGEHRALAHRLFTQHEGNIRRVFEALYDVEAGVARPRQHTAKPPATASDGTTA